MNPGQLTERVTLQRLQQGTDEIGQPFTTWVTLGTTWASVEPLVGREYFAAGGAQSEVTAKVRMRYRPGITSADRLIHEGTLYSITSVINYKSANRDLVLMCKG